MTVLFACKRATQTLYEKQLTDIGDIMDIIIFPFTKLKEIKAKKKKKKSFYLMPCVA